MGQVDITILMGINEEIKKLNTPYHFKVDHGSFETAIEFTAIGYNHPPKSNNWEESRENGNEIKCPDLLDYTNKIIIEYEEEGQKSRPGASIPTKGHGPQGDITNTRDTHRDYLYRIAGFKLLKIWESEYKDNSYVGKLKEFLIP